MALPCSSGAEPKPDWVGRAIQARMDWLPPNVLSLIETVSPLSTSQQIVGNLVASTLCANQVQDPGPLNLGDLLWDLAGGAVPNPNGSPGTLGWWIGQKLSYYAFFEVCQCLGTGQPPPSPIVPTPPSGSQPYPTDPTLQPPLDRIEQNQRTGNDGQVELYQGLQVVATHLSDLWTWQTPNNSEIYPAFAPVTMSGEGRYDFPRIDALQHPYWDVAGVDITILQMPAVFKARGTLNPRYYGVGSLYWYCQQTGTTELLTSRRESIHYRRQLVASPREWIAKGIGWYLQPGTVLQMRHIIRGQQEPTATWYTPHSDAFTGFGGLVIPDHIQDPPLWPPVDQARDLPAGGGLPPAQFPCCS